VADARPKELLQPSLLDRLTDREPEKAVEAGDYRAFNLARFRNSVVRDLGWLLNTDSLASTEDLEHFPELCRSVLNFGIRNLTGSTASGLDTRALERSVRQAILAFEPRMAPKTVRVSARRDPDAMSHNTLTLEIEAELWAHPSPERVVLTSDIDLESGSVTVKDRGAR
jgi:type VI secretion system protein ImpF